MGQTIDIMHLYEQQTCSMCTQSKAAQHVFVQDNTDVLEILLKNKPSFMFIDCSFSNLSIQCVVRGNLNACLDRRATDPNFSTSIYTLVAVEERLKLI